jgi:tellurite resistance protein TehA-like permease
MGTGIVSIALTLGQHNALSTVWLVLTAIAWALLAIAAAVRLARDRLRLQAQLGTPAGLTAVAGTAVLGSRLLIAGLRVEAVVLLIAALAMWLGLYVAVLRSRQVPRSGVSFMLVVAVQSLSVLAALIAAAERSAWMPYAALAACGLGLALYPFVLWRFDLREVLVGAGDHWVAGGALAISALALSELSLTATRVDVLVGAVSALNTLAVVVWGAAAAWLLPLVAGEVLMPRLDYDLRRWSTVFPVGMYAVASFEVARAARLHWLRGFAGANVWLAVAVWVVVVAGMARHARRPGPAG